MENWYKNKTNLIELAEFLTDAGEITTAKELLDFFKYPEKYTEVFEIYQEEIIGIPISTTNHTNHQDKRRLKTTKDRDAEVPILVTLMK